MSSKPFTKLIASLMTGVMTLGALSAPLSAYAARDTFKAAYQDWYRFEVGDTGKSVLVPKDEPKLIGNTAKVHNNLFNDDLLKGGEMITYGMDALLDPNTPENVGTYMNLDFAGNPPWIIARYNPFTGELAIDAFKIVRNVDGQQGVYQVPFTPHHGEWFKAHRRFLTKDEFRNPYNLGFNPFGANFNTGFRGAASDTAFHNVGVGASKVAIALAMDYHKAAFALVVLPSQPDVQTTTSQSSSWGGLKKKVTTVRSAYTKPQFYLASPVNMGPSTRDAQLGVLCPRGDGQCTDPDQLAVGGISLDYTKALTEGNVKGLMAAELTGQTVDQTSSWTALFYAIVGGTIAFFSGGVVGGDMLLYGLYGAAASTVDTYLFKGGNFADGQKGLLGGLASKDVTAGVTTGTNCGGDALCNQINSNVTTRLTAPDALDETAGNNFPGMITLVRGVCPANMSVADCEAANKTKTDDYKDPNKAPGLHPAGAFLYRTDSFISDIPANRMNAAAIAGKCKDPNIYKTRKAMAACIKTQMN